MGQLYPVFMSFVRSAVRLLWQ